MKLILEFLVTHMSFFWDSGDYRIVASEVRGPNAGDGALTIESPILRLRFICDRRQLFLDLQPTATEKAGEWYSIDLIRRLLRGSEERSALLDASYASFLRDSLEEITKLFSTGNWPATREDLEKLKVRRAKELFG